MARYKEFFEMGFTLRLENGVVVSFFEQKDEIGMRVSQGDATIAASLSPGQWEELCELRYSLSLVPMIKKEKNAQTND